MTTTREQLIAWARKEFGVSNGTQTWIEFQGSAESLADAILAANLAPAQVVGAEQAWDEGYSVGYADGYTSAKYADDENPYRKDAS